jgi:hypothetical protein
VEPDSKLEPELPVLPEPPLEPEFPVEPEPMCGQGGLLDGADPCPGAGGVGVRVEGVVDCVLVGAELLVVLGAAAAPAIPATAPPVASAPTTRVAPSSLDTVMLLTSFGRLASVSHGPFRG